MFLCTFPELANHALKDMINRVIRKLVYQMDPPRLFEKLAYPVDSQAI